MIVTVILPLCKQILVHSFSILLHSFNLVLHDHRSFAVLLALNAVLGVEEVAS
jgi:hypothetical protein